MPSSVAFKSKEGEYLGLLLIFLCDIKIPENRPMCKCVYAVSIFSSYLILFAYHSHKSTHA